MARLEQLWQRDDEILLLVTSGGDYAAAVQASVEAMLARFGHGVLLSANRPAESVRKALDPTATLHVVDCITGLTGFLPGNTADTLYIESPSLLEKASMRAQQILRRLPPPAPMMVDSLSALAMYNGEPAVAELAHTLITRLRMAQHPAAFLVVETQSDAGFIDDVASYCDRLVRVDGTLLAPDDGPGAA